MNTYIQALSIYSFTGWFAWILQRDVKRYQGTWGPVIQPILGLLSVLGWLISIAFLILLFFRDSFSWYEPLTVALLGQVINILVLVPLYVIITRASFLLSFVVDVVSVIGLIVSIVLQVYFFHATP